MRPATPLISLADPLKWASSRIRPRSRHWTRFPNPAFMGNKQNSSARLNKGSRKAARANTVATTGVGTKRGTDETEGDEVATRRSSRRKFDLPEVTEQGGGRANPKVRVQSFLRYDSTNGLTSVQGKSAATGANSSTTPSNAEGYKGWYDTSIRAQGFDYEEVQEDFSNDFNNIESSENDELGCTSSSFHFFVFLLTGTSLRSNSRPHNTNPCCEQQSDGQFEQ